MKGEEGMKLGNMFPTRLRAIFTMLATLSSCLRCSTPLRRRSWPRMRRESEEVGYAKSPDAVVEVLLC